MASQPVPVRAFRQVRTRDPQAGVGVSVPGILDREGRSQVIRMGTPATDPAHTRYMETKDVTRHPRIVSAPAENGRAHRDPRRG